MITLLLMAAGAPALQVGEITLADRKIRVGDIAAAPGHEEQIIGTLPAASKAVELNEAGARQMLRNRFPSLDFALRFDGRVRLSAPAVKGVERGTCYIARDDLLPGETVTPLNTVAAECPAQLARAPIGYDAATGSVYARKLVPAGTMLGALRLKAAEIVPEGKAMTLRFAAGPVIVEREVISLQPSVPGERVFVKTKDGDVITARLSRSEEGTAQ